MTRNPILAGLTPALVTGLITAVVNLANAFGWLTISSEQLEALNTLATTLILILGAGGVAYARDRSTPTASPKLDEGTVVEVVTPPGQDNREVTL